MDDHRSVRTAVAGLGLRPGPRLAEAARRASALITADAVVTVPIPETGEVSKAGGIRARDTLIEIQRRTTEALAGIDDRIITVGGDCAVDIPSIAAAHDALRRRAHGVVDRRAP